MAPEYQGKNKDKHDDNESTLPSTSRRSFLSLSAAASAALALRIVTEPMLAHARVHNFPKDAIRIDSNENPLGPGASAREAIAAIIRRADGIPTISPTIW